MPTADSLRPRLYFAAPLFSEAELTYNAQMKSSLSVWFDVYLPQEDGLLFSEAVRAGQDPRAVSGTIFDTDLAAILACDVLLAVLDGRSIDEGVAFEIGFAYSRGKVCLGLQTDPRRLQPAGNNPMIQGALRSIFPDRAALFTWASTFNTAAG